MLSLTCVTGCPGSGKSHLSRTLKGFGFDVIAIDDYANSILVEDDPIHGKKYQWIVDISKIVQMVHSINGLSYGDTCCIAIEGTCSNFTDLYNALVEEFHYVCVFFIYELPVVLREVYKKRIHLMSKADPFYDAFVKLSKKSDAELKEWSTNRILEVTDKGINVRFISRGGYLTIIWLILFVEILLAKYQIIDPSTLSLINDSDNYVGHRPHCYKLLESTEHVSKHEVHSIAFNHMESDFEFKPERLIIAEMFRAMINDYSASVNSNLISYIRSSNKDRLCKPLDFLLECREQGVIK